MSLRLCSGFSLPEDAATRRMAIVAMSGAGKSNLAVVMAEEMHKAGIPWVVIDPKGDWYGIRSAKDGKRPGLPIPVFGGLHGDVPLEPTAGKMMAELIATKRLTCVLDVSEFDTRSGMFSFLRDFAETLLKKNKEPLHVFCEEADDYLPQKAGGSGGNVAACLGAWQRLIKRGRFRGIGSTLITQRTSAINKDALNMAELLFAMRVTAPHDRKAVKAWVEGQGLDRGLVDSLPSLMDGEAWAWSPAWLRSSTRFRSRLRSTFDSGKTPEIGRSVEPAKLADIDLGEIKQQMAATIERAEAEDPKKLQAEIRRLRTELSRQRPAVDQAAIASAVLDATAAQVKKLDAQEFVFAEFADISKEFMEMCGERFGDLTNIARRMHELCKDHLEVEALIAKHKSRPKPVPPQAVAPAPVAPRPARPPNGDDGLTGPQRRVVDAVAWWNSVGVAQPSKIQLAFVAGYKPNTGSFNNTLGALRSTGLIEYPMNGHVALTDSGSALATAATIDTSLSAFHGTIFAKLTGPQQRLLEPLLSAYPGSLSSDELASASGYQPNTGSFNNTRGSLRSLGLVEYPSAGMVTATGLLFPGGLS